MTQTSLEKKVYINTLGCPKNEVDGEILAAHLIGAGWIIVDDPDHAGAEIVNTCGFISQAKSESIDAIFEAVFRRKQQGGRIIITGCLAQRHGQELCEQIPQADAIIGVHRPDLVVRVLDGKEKPTNGRICWVSSPNEPMQIEQELRSIPPASYGYIKISDGCNNRCAYCIIPTIRGDLRCSSMESILDEAQRFVEGGVREIILVGQDTAAYTTDNGKRELPELLRRLNDIPGDFWIRILYMHPINLTDEIVAAVAQNEKVVPYFDIPLQHITDQVLTAMQRKVDRRFIEERLDYVRETVPGVTIRSTFLIGHPGETAEEFKELFNFIEGFEFDRLGLFAYSPEEGTASFSREDAPPIAVTDQRVEQLSVLQETIAARHSERRVGQRLRCLLETPSAIQPGMWEGRTTGDAPEIDGTVFVTGNNTTKCGFAEVTVEQADGYDLFGRIS